MKAQLHFIAYAHNELYAICTRKDKLTEKIVRLVGGGLPFESAARIIGGATPLNPLLHQTAFLPEINLLYRCTRSTRTHPKMTMSSSCKRVDEAQ